MTGVLAAISYSPGGGGSSVQLHNQGFTVFATNATATATYTITNTGNVTSNFATLEAWLTGGAAANYEVMATQTSGNTVSGTMGSWLNCGTSRAWSLSNSARDDSVLTGVFTVQIRDVATHTVQASASITISAESDALR